jgi:uncharacterized protein (TIGR02145 family)
MNLIDWSDGPYFLKVEADPNGGNNYTLSTVSEILMAPVAKFAEHSGGEFDGSFSDLAGRPDVENWDQNVADDFNGSYTSLNGRPVIASINDGAASASAVWSASRTSSAFSDKAVVTGPYTKTNLQTTGQASVNFLNLGTKPANLDEDKTDELLLSGDQTVNGGKSFTKAILTNADISNSNNTLKNVGTPVSAGDAVPKSYVDALITRIETLESLHGGFVKDYDGNIYPTVKIGEQVWMAENLKTRHTAAGATLSVLDPNNDAENVATYGLLYDGLNMSDELCPTGMHIPEDGDWKQLEEYLGMSRTTIDSFYCRGTDEAKRLKGNGDTGFNALYAGYFRTYEYYGFGTRVDFWCKNTIFEPESGIPIFVNRTLSSDSDKICRGMTYAGTHNANYGSVRCVKNLIPLSR